MNLDELDYLAKRLESFDDGEAAQSQAMASKLELFELKAQIHKSHIYAYFSGRNESEVIVDPKHLTEITQVQAMEHQVMGGLS